MIIYKAEDLSKLHNFILNNEHLAFDIETTGLLPIKDKIIGFGVSNGSTGFYVVHLKWDGEKLVESVSKSACIAILELLKHRKWTGWNSSFEVRFCRHYFDVELSNSLWSDGMLAKHTVDEERPFQLKEVSKIVFGSSAVDEQLALKKSIKDNGGDPSKDYFMADSNVLGEYCIQDCVLTYKLNDMYVSDINSQNLNRFYFDDEVMPLYKNVTINMEDRGILLDLPLLNKSYEEIQKDINNLEDTIQVNIDPLLDDFKKWYLNKEFPVSRGGDFSQAVCSYFSLDLPKTKSGRFSILKKNVEALENSDGKSFLLGEISLPADVCFDIQRHWYSSKKLGHIFNLNSKDHLKRLFFDKLGEEPVSKTKKGSPQVDKIFLDNMAKKYEWANLLLQYNALVKIKGVSMERFIEASIDGVFYPSFFQHRTISGRYGSNLQQLNRPKEVGEASDLVLKYNNLIRKFFIARPGYKFIDADYESLEPHVFAHVSGDDGLKDIFKNGHDFYSTIAIRTEGLQGVSADKKADNYLGKVSKSVRQNAKAYSLGVPYGLGDYALSKQLDIPQSEAKTLIEQYLDAFPDLAEWMETSFQDCITKGYVSSEAGRVRHMPKAPKIWFAHKDYILDNLKMWHKFNGNPSKYAQIKFLHKELKNYINNSRNFQIQSLAASITSRACIAINKEFKRMGIDGGVVAQIHDQIITEVPVEYAEQMRKTVQFLMENTYKISLKLKAPAELGNNFYDAH